MLACKTAKTIDSYELFKACKEVCGRDLEGEFNEVYMPPEEGGVWFTMPDTKEEIKEYDDYQQIIIRVLLNSGALTYGERCLVLFDY